MRTLPDPDLSLRDASDFIFGSALARKALSDPHPRDLAVFLRDLIQTIYRLTQSCHLPEFTDHGLGHLCSLVDRLSQWTSADASPVLIVDQLSPEEASILLIGTLLHDIGMLSQRPEDLPGTHASKPIQDIPTWVRRTHVGRMERLARHLIELTWFHTVNEGQWKEILKKWVSTGPKWMKAALEGFDERLQIQAQLTSPGRKVPALPESAASGLQGKFPLASLWLLHLYANRAEIGKLVTQKLAEYNIDDYQWRLVADFGHTNFWTGGSPDSQGAWIARRRSMTLRFPILVFHDRRELAMNEMVLDLLRSEKPDQGHDRQELFQLSMLHELAALRIWDYWMWRDAIRAQSEASLEASQWPGDGQEILAVNGLIHGIRVNFLEKQSKLVDKAIEKLEFAPHPLVRTLAEAVLANYPNQQRSTDTLLVKVADLFPEDLWPKLADWTLSYAKGFRDRRSFGFKLNTLEHWPLLIPSLSENSTAWTALQPEVLSLARTSHTWRGGDTEELLLDWLIFAPINLAVELGELIASYPASTTDEKFARARIFAEAEKARPALNRQFTERLAAEPNEILVATLLASHLERLSADQRQVLRTDLERRTDNFLRQALPPLNSREFQMGGWVPGYELLSWNKEDLPLLEKLISALNSPNLLGAYVGNLLNMVQLMAAFGSPEISRRLIPEIKRWMDPPPLGSRPSSFSSNVFSIVHLSDGSLNIDRELGWLVFQVVRKLDVEGQKLALDWTQKTLFSKGSAHLTGHRFNRVGDRPRSPPSSRSLRRRCAHFFVNVVGRRPFRRLGFCG
jgi:hypothetical protein